MNELSVLGRVTAVRAVGRVWRGAVHAVATLALLGSAGCASAVECQADGLAYVGTDTSAVQAVRFDACTGRLSALGTVAELPKPRWVVAHPKLPVVYVGNEGRRKEGGVSAFGFDRRSGALTPLNDVDAGGAGTTFLALDVPSMTLLAANFGGGSAASLSIEADGRVSPVVSRVVATGSGPHRRQTSPHAHAVTIDPSGTYALVPDMGADRLFVYDFDRASRTLSADAGVPPRSYAFPPGSGPRRALFGATGRYVYVLSELTAEISVMRWSDEVGRLVMVQTLPTSTPEFKGGRSVSEIALSRDGRFVYVGDRGENTLVVYAIDPKAGTLTLVQRLPSGGEGPWAFELHPSGRWLVVANYRSDRLNTFAVDVATGRLTDTGESLVSKTPVSVTFVN